MFKSTLITTYQTEMADAAWLPHAANLLGSGRPSGFVTVFARRRAR
jgi:hypothetical protein